MKKINHGIRQHEVKYIKPEDKFKHGYKIRPTLGRAYYIPLCVLGVQAGLPLPDYLPFIVTKIFPHVVILERHTAKGVNRQAVNKWTFARYATFIPSEDFDLMAGQFESVSVPI